MFPGYQPPARSAFAISPRSSGVEITVRGEALSPAPACSHYTAGWSAGPTARWCNGGESFVAPLQKGCQNALAACGGVAQKSLRTDRLSAASRISWEWGSLTPSTSRPATKPSAPTTTLLQPQQPRRGPRERHRRGAPCQCPNRRLEQKPGCCAGSCDFDGAGRNTASCSPRCHALNAPRQRR